MNELEINELKGLRGILPASLTAAQAARKSELELKLADMVAKAKQDSQLARTRASRTPASTDELDAIGAIERDTLAVAVPSALLSFDNMGKDGKTAWYRFRKGNQVFSVALNMATWKDLEVAPEMVEVDLVLLQQGKRYRWVSKEGVLKSVTMDTDQYRTAQGSYPKPMSLAALKTATEIAVNTAALRKAMREADM